MLNVQTSLPGEEEIWIKATHLITTRPPQSAQGSQDTVPLNQKLKHIKLLEDYLRTAQHSEVQTYSRIFHYRTRKFKYNNQSVTQTVIILTLKKGIRGEFTHQVVITDHDDQMKNKPRLILTTRDTQLEEFTQPSVHNITDHAVNIIEGGDASTHINNVDYIGGQFIFGYLFNTMDINLDDHISSENRKGGAPKSCVLTQPSTDGSNMHATNNNNQNTVQNINNEPQNNINTKYLTYKEPSTIKQALNAPDSVQWEEAMNVEMKQLEELKTMIPISEHDTKE
jgi:hypothetical protein